MDDILSALQRVEALAEDVIKTKQEIIDLNIKVNKNREAINSLKRRPNCDKNSNKFWICFGNSFIKTTDTSVKTLIIEDQNQLNERINGLRNDLKPKVDRLREWEGKEVLKGFDLKPLDKQELKALNTLL